MNTLALLRVSLTVGDLDRQTAFYVDALGFTAEAKREMDDATARLLDARSVRTVLLRRGGQELELAAFDPPGQSYPPDSRSNDVWFHHCALVTGDIRAAYDRLCGHAFEAISLNGPQTLPGGIIAFKFRDPEGHPLELIQFPDPHPATADGIDHSAIAVADTARSIAFYASELGMAVVSRQVNAGRAQDALDGLDATEVDVVGLAPARPAPHVELLGYRSPRGRSRPVFRPADAAASRLVLEVDDLSPPFGAALTADGGAVALMHDPDGHALLLIKPPRYRPILNASYFNPRPPGPFPSCRYPHAPGCGSGKRTRRYPRW